MLKATIILKTIIKEGSFQGAAKELNVTQPYLSQCIQRMERRCRTPVIDRGSKPVKLTDAGKVFLKMQSEIEALEEQSQTYFDDLAGLQTGRLVIASNGERTAAVLVPAVAEFHRLYPGITVDFSRDFRFEVVPAALIQGQADLGVMFESLLTKDLNAVVLAKERYLLAAPNVADRFGACFNKDGTYPLLSETDCSQLKPYRLIQTYGHPERLQKLNQHFPFEMKESPVGTYQLSTRLALTAAGVGVSICQEHLIAPLNVREQCRFASLEGILPVQNLVLAWNDRRYMSKAAKEFCRIVRDTFRTGFM